MVLPIGEAFEVWFFALYRCVGDLWSVSIHRPVDPVYFSVVFVMNE
jgi:hypothetical protein